MQICCRGEISPCPQAVWFGDGNWQAVSQPRDTRVLGSSQELPLGTMTIMILSLMLPVSLQLKQTPQNKVEQSSKGRGWQTWKVLKEGHVWVVYWRTDRKIKVTENTHPAQKFEKSFFLKGCFSISEPGHLPLCEGLKKRQISLGNQGVISMCEHSGEKVDWKKKWYRQNWCSYISSVI